MINRDIIKGLESLVQYGDVKITHTFGEHRISYSKLSKEFLIENSVTGLIERYKDKESCSVAVVKILKGRFLRLFYVTTNDTYNYFKSDSIFVRFFKFFNKQIYM